MTNPRPIHHIHTSHSPTQDRSSIEAGFVLATTAASGLVDVSFGFWYVRVKKIPVFVGIKQCKCMVVLKDLPYNNALVGDVG